MELKDKNVLVVGLARTGEALCRFLVRRGARVRVSEKKPEEALGGRPASGAPAASSSRRAATSSNRSLAPTSSS